jgi:hypothetical protein
MSIHLIVTNWKARFSSPHQNHIEFLGGQILQNVLKEQNLTINIIDIGSIVFSERISIYTITKIV